MNLRMIIKEMVEKIHHLNIEYFRDNRDIPTVFFLPFFCSREEKVEMNAYYLLESIQDFGSVFWSKASEVFKEPCSCGCARLPLGYIIIVTERQNAEDPCVLVVMDILSEKTSAIAKILPETLGELEWQEGWQSVEKRQSVEKIVGANPPRLDDLKKLFEREIEINQMYL